MLYSRRRLVVVCHMRTTGFLLLLLLIHETHSAVTVGPSNQVAAVGALVTFPCTINSTGAAASWTWYSLANQACTVFNGFIMGSCVDPIRYSVTIKTNGQYNLNISSTLMSDAGTFVCSDLGTKGAIPVSAVYGVMGSEPVVTSNTSQSCLYEGDHVVLTCRASYNGSSAMPLLMTWTTSSGQPVNSNMTNDTVTGLFQSTAYILATTSNIPVHRCNVTFTAPTSDHGPSGAALATNAPTYSRVSTSSAYTVQYCPRTIRVTLSNGAEFAGGQVEEGTVVNCSVDDGSSSVTTTYSWTTTTNGDILSNSPYVIIPVCDYNLTCTANSTVSCGVGSTKTCDNLTKTINGTALQLPMPQKCYERMECIVPVVVVPLIVAAATVIIGILLIKGIIPGSYDIRAKNRDEKDDYKRLNSQTTSAVNNAGYQYCQKDVEELGSSNRRSPYTFTK